MTARAVLLGALISVLAGCGGPDILTSEPGGGGLAKGQSVMVDDGKCPEGQLNRITGAATLTGTRSYACVPRR